MLIGRSSNNCIYTCLLNEAKCYLKQVLQFVIYYLARTYKLSTWNVDPPMISQTIGGWNG